jgi:hypothetical protein
MVLNDAVRRKTCDRLLSQQNIVRGRRMRLRDLNTRHLHLSGVKWLIVAGRHAKVTLSRAVTTLKPTHLPRSHAR